jgi:hypothetical protein
MNFGARPDAKPVTTFAGRAPAYAKAGAGLSITGAEGCHAPRGPSFSIASRTSLDDAMEGSRPAAHAALA